MSTLSMFAPNRAVSKRIVRLLFLSQLAVFLLLWFASGLPLLPTPPEIVRALVSLWSQDGLAVELFTSFTLNLEAIALATLVSLLLAYSTVIAFMRPLVTAISKMRFLSMAGLTYIFTLVTRGGHELKLALLVFAITVFFVTSMADVIEQIPKEKYDLARTLRMGEWRVVWEVIVLGRFEQVFDVLRQNAAIGWMMLTMVEGMVRSEGGIGALLLNQNKYFRLDAVFAIQAMILTLGLAQDYGIGLLKRLVCPYAFLTLEKR